MHFLMIAESSRTINQGIYDVKTEAIKTISSLQTEIASLYMNTQQIYSAKKLQFDRLRL